MLSQRLLLPSRRLFAGLRPTTQLRRSSFRIPDAYRAPRPPQPASNPNRQERQDPQKEDQTKENQKAEGPRKQVQFTDSISSILHDTNPSSNPLIAPVHIPEDAHAIITTTHPAADILLNPSIIVQRQLEMMNMLVGFEQANRYILLDANGVHIGFMTEQDNSVGSTVLRQWAGTHRSVTTCVFDKRGKEVLRFHRPFSFINSHIRVFDPVEPANRPLSSPVQTSSEKDVVPQQPETVEVSQLPMENMRVIGEAHQEWHLLRRKYNLFLFNKSPNHETDLGRQSMPFKGTGMSDIQQQQPLQNQAQANSPDGEFHQFAYIDEPFMSWDFSLKTSDDRLIGSVNRNFSGLAREVFTDTGVYVLRMDSVSLSEEATKAHNISQTNQTPSVYDNKRDSHTGMTLDQRAIMLATAVAVDFDYFSRHSNSHGGILPFPIPFFGWGGSAAEGAGAAGAAEAGAGAVAGEGAAGTASGVAGGMAGAGTIAGYEAMQSGFGSRGDGDSQAGNTQDKWAAEQQQGQQQNPQESAQQPFDERPWWEQDQEVQQQEQNPWGNQEHEDQGWGDMDEDGDGDGDGDFFF